MSFTVIPTSVFILSRANAKKKQPLEVFYKEGVLKKFGKFTGKHLSLFLWIF